MPDENKEKNEKKEETVEVIESAPPKNMSTEEIHELLKKSKHPKSGDDKDRPIMKDYQGPKAK
jgi:isochorismate hydrolase